MGHLIRGIILRYEVSFIGLSEIKVVDLSRADVDRLAGRNWNFFAPPRCRHVERNCGDVAARCCSVFTRINHHSMHY